jgi:hypothetical protein
MNEFQRGHKNRHAPREGWEAGSGVEATAPGRHGEPLFVGRFDVRLPRVRIRTLIVIVALAGVGLTALRSTDGFRFVFGLLCPAALLSMGLADTIRIAFSASRAADSRPVDESEPASGSIQDVTDRLWREGN